jgi:DNA-binding MarR family transcriptional regulator
MLTADARRALRAWLRLVRIAEPVQLALLERYGVTFSELHALRILRDLGQVPISRYAEALAISRSTATGVLDRFEQRGLAQREASRTDRRVILVAITPLGRQALEHLTVFEESEPGQRIARLPVARQRQLVAIAEALTGEPIGDSSPEPVHSGQEVVA